MTTAWRVLELILVLVAGWFVTWRVLPSIFVRAGRLLGFRMRFTPVTAKRVARFRRIRRGYFSFAALTTAFVLSLFLELLVNNRAVVIHYDGRTAFPALAEWADGFLPFAKISYFQKASDFGQVGESEVDYHAFERWSADPSTLLAEVDAETKALASEKAKWLEEHPEPAKDAQERARRNWETQKKGFERRLVRREEANAKRTAAYDVFSSGRAWSWMPLYPHSPSEHRLNFEKRPPNKPSAELGIPFGTDVSGRDVVPLILYGFRTSFLFALIVLVLGYLIGVVVGAMQGYFGGWLDLITQRVVEIWGAIPFLFVIMIIVSMVQPTFFVLVALFVILRGWEGITYYVRGEYLRERAKDYVQAAVGTGVRDRRIILSHILPNSLVPLITFAPFTMVAYIFGIISLDYLGFGLPPGTPSWGALLRDGLDNVRTYPHLTYIPTAALVVTLFATVLIGEAVREAFDPKVFSRLR